MTDITGRVIDTQYKPTIAGINTIEVKSADQLNAGIYFVRLTINGETQVLKLVKN
jgi:hypothetical protein